MAESVTIEKYVIEQEKEECDFRTSDNDMIRDKIIFSMNEQRLKERLLREPHFTFEKPIVTCQARAQQQWVQLPRRELHQRKNPTRTVNHGHKGREQPVQHTQISGQRNTCKKCKKKGNVPDIPCVKWKLNTSERQAHQQTQPTRRVLVTYGGTRLRAERTLTLKHSTGSGKSTIL